MRKKNSVAYHISEHNKLRQISWTEQKKILG